MPDEPGSNRSPKPVVLRSTRRSGAKVHWYNGNTTGCQPVIGGSSSPMDRHCVLVVIGNSSDFESERSWFESKGHSHGN